MKIPTNRFLWLKKNPFEKSFPFFENKKKKNVEIFFFFWNAAKLFIGEFLLPFVNVSSVNENVKDSFLRFLTHFLFPQSFSLSLSLYLSPSFSFRLPFFFRSFPPSRFLAFRALRLQQVGNFFSDSFQSTFLNAFACFYHFAPYLPRFHVKAFDDSRKTFSIV